MAKALLEKSTPIRKVAIYIITAMKALSKCMIHTSYFAFFLDRQCMIKTPICSSPFVIAYQFASILI